MASFKDWIKKNILDKTRLDEIAQGYVKGRIVKPSQEATKIRESGQLRGHGILPKIQYGANLLGSAFSMTPIGLGYNTAESLVTAGLKTNRESPGGYANLLLNRNLLTPEYRKDFGREFERNMGTWESGVISRGLGIDHPAAIAGDILLDPASAPGVVKGISKLSMNAPDIIRGFKKISPEDFTDIGKTLTKKTYEEAPKGVKFGDEALQTTFKTERSRKLADTIHKAFSLQGKNSFDADKAKQGISYYIKRLGDDAVQSAYDSTLKWNKPQSITNFWTSLKQQALKKGFAGWDEWSEAVAKRQADIEDLATRESPQKIAEMLATNKTKPLADKIAQLEEGIINKVGIDKLNDLALMKRDLGLGDEDYLKMLGTYYKNPDLFGDLESVATKIDDVVEEIPQTTEKVVEAVEDIAEDTIPQVDNVKQVVEEVVEEIPTFTPDVTKPLAPQFRASNVPLKDKLPQIRPALEARFSKLDEMLSANGMTREEFGEIVSRTKPGELPVSLKKAYKELKDITDDLGEIAKTPFKKRQDFGFAHVWEGQRELMEVVPDTWVSVMNRRFMNALPRTKQAEGFIKDPLQAMIDYTERAVMDRHAEEVMAKALKITPEEAADRIKFADKLARAKQADDIKSVDTIDYLKAIYKKHRGGKGVGTRKVDKSISLVDKATDTHYSNLEKLGIYDVFEGMSRWRAEAVFTIDEIKPLIQRGDYDEALRLMRIKYPEIEDASFLIDGFVRARTENDLMKAEKNFESVIKKATYQQRATEFEQKLVELSFAGTDKAMQRYVSDLAGKMLTQRISAQDAATKVNRVIQKSYASALLGLKPSTILQQIFEGKRLFAESDAKTTATAFKKTLMEIQQDGTPTILKKYGKEQSLISEFFDGKGIKYDKDVFNKYDELQDKVLRPMMEADRFKNAWFLHAFEMMADARGYTGKKKMNYVLGKFENLAHTYTGLDIIDMFENKWIKTALQFSHYTFKDLRLAQRKVAKGDWRYLGRLGLMNAAILYGTSKIFGWGFSQVFGSTPSFGPIADTADEAIDFVGDMVRERAEEDPQYAEVMKALGIELATTMALPAGSQIYKTTKAVGDLNRGYAESPTGRVRFPMPDDPLGQLQALAFGTTSTDEWAEYSGQNRMLPYTVNKMLDSRRNPLGEKQSENFRTIAENSPDRARQYYDNVMGDREEEGKKSVTGILDTASAGMPGSSGSASPMYEIFMENEAISDKRTLITNVMKGEEKGSGESFTERMQYLQDLGVTEQDIADWEMWKMSNFTVDEKVNMIMEMEQIDFEGLYKNEVLSLNVLKELEAKGFITDAKALWEKLELTDPTKAYFEGKENQEEAKKLEVKYMSKLLKNRADTTIKVLKAQQKYKNKTMKEILKAQNGSKVKQIKIPSLGGVKVKRPPNPKPYKPYVFPEI